MIVGELGGIRQGKTCDDKNLCTSVDQCDGKGFCSGVPYACTPTACQSVSKCDGKGGCATANKKNGTQCDDKKVCTQNDICTGGVCGGAPYTCPAPGKCQAQVTCNGKGGCSVTHSKQGTQCDDAKLCTKGDVCDGKGGCAGTPYLCNDKVACTIDTCDGKGGCNSTLAAGFCFIGNSCKTKGAVNPANKCQQCDPTKSTTTWSAVPGCTLCGDGKITHPELCDGNLLNGETCQSHGQDGGTLKCVQCKFDLSGCFKCATGTADCNGKPGDLCETNLLTDLNNCGKCKKVCPTAPANGVAACKSGNCSWSCKSGYFKIGSKCWPDQVKEVCDKQDNDFDKEVDEGCGIGTCGDPRVVNPRGGKYSHNSNGYGSYSGSCGMTKGLEFIYRWKPPTSGTATVHIKTNYWPCALYVRKGSCSGNELTCKASSGTWPDYSMTFSVTAGTTYYVFADNNYGGSVALSHTITFTAP